eukprot:4220178-Amphidinium_carterae.1
MCIRDRLATPYAPPGNPFGKPAVLRFAACFPRFMLLDTVSGGVGVVVRVPTSCHAQMPCLNCFAHSGKELFSSQTLEFTFFALLGKEQIRAL